MKDDRLNSWKEISIYMGRDIVTCIKWERLYRLPIYRIDPQSNRSRVFAYKPELEQWFRDRKKP
jgi:hypothetical protein